MVPTISIYCAGHFLAVGFRLTDAGIGLPLATLRDLIFDPARAQFDEFKPGFLDEYNKSEALFLERLGLSS